MPCTPGMTGCKADCGHRRFIMDYIAERDAQLARAEAETKGYETEEAEYFGPDGPEERWTFQRHLTQYQGRMYPYPSTDREEPPS